MCEGEACASALSAGDTRTVVGRSSCTEEGEHPQGWKPPVPSKRGPANGCLLFLGDGDHLEVVGVG